MSLVCQAQARKVADSCSSHDRSTYIMLPTGLEGHSNPSQDPRNHFFSDVVPLDCTIMIPVGPKFKYFPGGGHAPECDSMRVLHSFFAHPSMPIQFNLTTPISDSYLAAVLYRLLEVVHALWGGLYCGCNRIQGTTTDGRPWRGPAQWKFTNPPLNQRSQCTQPVPTQSVESR